MGKVYVAMICDRHTAPEPYVFTTPDAAIGYARDQARANAGADEDIEEEPVAGWLFHARYSGEGDSVWVIEKEIDDAAA